MNRHLLKLLTVLSVLSCVAVAALWVASYRYLYAAGYQSARVELVEWDARSNRSTDNPPDPGRDCA